MSTAAVESPVLSASPFRRITGSSSMSKSKACRRLFGPSDDDQQEDGAGYLQEQLRNMEEKKRRWQFDFAQGKPLDGSPWEAMPKEKVPSFYHETPLTLRSPRIGRRAARPHRSPISSARTRESPDLQQQQPSSTQSADSSHSNNMEYNSGSTSDCAPSPSRIDTSLGNLPAEKRPESETDGEHMPGRLSEPQYNQPSLARNRSSTWPLSSSSGKIVQSRITDFGGQRKRRRHSFGSGGGDATTKRTRESPAVPSSDSSTQS